MSAPEPSKKPDGSKTEESWRGVAAENNDAVTRNAAALLHKRSRALLGSLVRPYRKALIFSALLIVVNTIADLSVPYLIGRAIDRGITPHIGEPGLPTSLIVILGLILVAVVFESVSIQFFLRVSGRFTQDVLRDLRMRCFRHFQGLSLSFYERYTSGRVIARMTSDIDALTELLSTGINDVVTNFLSLFGIAIMLLVLDMPLAAATLAVFPLVVLLTKWFKKRAHAVYRQIRRTVALVIIHTVESLSGIRAVQAYRREPRNAEIMADVNRQYCAANVESIRLLSILSPGLGILGRIATAVVLLYGGFRVLDDQIMIGVLVSFVLLVRRFFEPLNELSQVYNLLQAAAAALENLSGVLDEKPEVPEPLEPRIPESVRGGITFEHVRFGYREATILHDLDLTIPPGQTVALVGETGAGKTTIARMVARFWDPSDGHVKLDDVDLRDIPDEVLRRHIAMVTQESFLFSGTIADNIELGMPGATREQIVAAATAIGAHAFIAALPDGYDTDVRKRGGRLSAGQRQLVSFARAFLADPAVLILDEATSSLDIPSERAVQHALRTLLADRTAFIIAHRLSTVEVADRVLVIDAGRVVEDGAPADLLGGTGRYAALHDAWVDSLA